MTISREQYDSINVGDFVAASWKRPSTGNWENYEGEVYLDSYGKKMVGNLCLANRTEADKGINKVVVLEHKSKPVPAWHSAQVIEVTHKTGNYKMFLLRDTTRYEYEPLVFTDQRGVKFDVKSLAAVIVGEPTVIVA